MEDSRPAPTDAELDGMSFKDLDTLRLRVTEAQNLKNPLLRLPAELRNRIWHLACVEDLELQINHSETRAVIAATSNSRDDTPLPALHPPSFLSACHQIKHEAAGVLYDEIMIWQEYIHRSDAWKKLKPKAITALFHIRSVDGAELMIDREISKDPEQLVMNTAKHASPGYRVGVVFLPNEMGHRAVSWNIGRGYSNLAMLRFGFS